ncbi:hypothetical protein CLV62_104112 [Dysgonomonas alginatilytica]|uniref:Uncharacterized protein n=1 Tax=Dysgonomonas alginatilytica TaxID=1605892 RepID=A0A2V3PTJ5_9BACT|nr:hypothetical protein [Dysgonomonas alginatilytica]PXV66851.1 hypothetical protein CLV62_104112 [Dysgonomonas alginatilytica]
MKIRLSKDFKVELSTLVRFEWRKYYPVLIIHERFEKIIKYTIWAIIIITILSSLLVFQNCICSLILAITLFLLQKLFEKTIFEYTTVVFAPLPDFAIDNTQWLTNAFLIPTNEDDTYDKSLPATFSICFRDENYAKKVFELFKQWNYEEDNDTENNIIISFVVEPNEKYSTYIYQNPRRKNPDKYFEKVKEKNKLEKYGKQQQRFLVGFILGKKLDFKNGMLIKLFLDFQEQNKLFNFMPSTEITVDGKKGVKFLNTSTINKYGFELKKRNELTKKDFEYHYPI